MKTARKTVLFGPFVGEFGWELLYWQGWVRRACRTVFKDYYKIAASFPGRYAFYPDADEFRGHPPDITGKRFISSKAYTTDNWFAGRAERGQEHSTAGGTGELWEGSSLHDTLVEHYKKNLPDDVLVLSPAVWIDLPDLPPAFGTQAEINADGTYTLRSDHVSFSRQILETVRPAGEGGKIMARFVSPDKKLVSVFPRARMTRRADKNWTRENYAALIDWLREKYPEYTVAVLGEPGGAFFAEGDMPEGCIDLINIAPLHRMDAQVAALNQSVMAIGSISGATLFAKACGCPTLEWGYIELRQRYHLENYLNTDMFYYPFMNPPVAEITRLADWFIRRHSGKRFLNPTVSKPFFKARLRLWRYLLRLWLRGQKDQAELMK